MKDKRLRFVLSIPAILYIVWYIFWMKDCILPILGTSLSNFLSLTIGQIIAVILAFSLLLLVAAISIVWLLVIWLEE